MAQINIPSTGIWSVIANALNTMFSEIFGRTGWADYVDTQYTEASPFTLPADQTVDLPNNAGTIVDFQKPTDITTFYDGTVITGRNGDDIIVTLDMQITPTSIATDFAEIWLDITGGTGTPTNLANLYKSFVTFPRGQNVARPVSIVMSGYELSTFQANGAVVKIRSNGGAATVHDIRYVVKRTHKAR